MQFLSVRCLACQNLDSFPRMSYEDIPYCSQCASTSDLVPETPPAATKAPAATTPDDLIALFNQQLYLSSSQQQQLATPPTSPIPATAKFSISQHYNHSMHHTPQQQQRQQQQQAPSPPSSAVDISDDDLMCDDDLEVSRQLYSEMQQLQKSADREYAEYLLASDLSSPNSLNELEIALAHGIVSGEEYARAVAGYTLATQREQAQRYQMQHQRKALEEDCSAMDMLRAAKSRDDMSAWCNDYYGGVDSGFVDDEEAPCSVYAGNAGCRLRPFDL